MKLQDILENKDQRMAFDAVLEEACRQWCEFIPDVPERMDGEGFADFFYETFEQKGNEYIREAKELAAEKAEKQEKKPSVLKKLKEKEARNAAQPTSAKNKQLKQEGMEL